jgi:hypothetical protein
VLVLRIGLFILKVNRAIEPCENVFIPKELLNMHQICMMIERHL